MNKKIIGIVALVIVIAFIAIIKGRSKNDYIAEDDKSIVSTVKNIGKSDEDLKEEQAVYLETVYSQADKLIASNNFDGAIQLYDEALKKYPKVDDINKKKLEAEALKEAYIKEKVVDLESEAQAYLDTEEYEKSIDKYNELYTLTNNEAYLVMVKSAEESLISDAINKADEYAKNGDFASAKTTINNAKSFVEDTTKLDEELNKLDGCEPVVMMVESSPINNIATDENGDCRFEQWSNVIGNDGKQYNGIGVCGNQGRGLNSLDGYFMECGLQTCSRTYYLEDYDTISGLLVLESDYKNTNCSMYLEIYCDDQLTYTSESITTGSLPVQVNADISGAKKVKVVWCCDYPNDSGSYFSDEYSFGFVNVTVSKKYHE